MCHPQVTNALHFNLWKRHFLQNLLLLMLILVAFIKKLNVPVTIQGVLYILSLSFHNKVPPYSYYYSNLIQEKTASESLTDSMLHGSSKKGIHAQVYPQNLHSFIAFYLLVHTEMNEAECDRLFPNMATHYLPT